MLKSLTKLLVGCFNAMAKKEKNSRKKQVLLFK